MSQVPQVPQPEIAEDTPSQATSAGTPAPRRRRRRAWLGELPSLIVVAVVLALLIKTFVVQAFYIPSPSMHDTLIENDRVLVNRMAYRFHPPRRGDVVVFQNPHPGPSHESALSAFVHWLGQGLGFSQGGRNKDFIKRVIGLPGDTIEMNHGVVYVNGTPLREPYVSPANVDRARYGPYVVPAGHLFVMGDNRTDSDDSRGSLGYIPMDKVLGRAFVLVWPPSRWRWLSGIDYGAVNSPQPPVPSAVPTG
jgi:signal peptidase I